MLLTKESDYAIRVVRALGSGNITTVRYISESEHVPQQFAYKILKKLEKNKIVVAHRGSIGGYQLVADLDELTLFDIVYSINNQLFINKCLREDYECPNNNNPEDEACCLVHHELKRVQSILVDALRERSMTDILSSATPLAY
jgi:Rrf2 family protein